MQDIQEIREKLDQKGTENKKNIAGKCYQEHDQNHSDIIRRKRDKSLHKHTEPFKGYLMI